MKINKFHTQIEKLLDKVHTLQFKFEDEDRQGDFDAMREEVAGFLEEMNDMASEEAEGKTEDSDE